MELQRRALPLMERRAHRWRRRPSATAAALLLFACCALITRASGEPSRSLQQAPPTVCWRKANNYPAQTCQPSACNNASE
jgi:hypothetical protein